MSLPPHDEVPQSKRRAALELIVIGIALFVIASVAMLIAYAHLDLSLGLVLAAPVCAMLCSMPLGAIVAGWRASLALALTITVPSAAPIVIAALRLGLFGSATVQLVLLCFAITLLTIEIPRLAKRLRLDPTLAATLLLLIAIAWLTLPVWMSPRFNTPVCAWVVDHLLAYQPLIALNGAYHTLGDWSHQPLAYTYLTNLGQDVPFALPESAWRCVALHIVIAIVAFGINAMLDRRRSLQPVQRNDAQL